MKRLVCEICGGTDILKEEGIFVCQSCGCKFSKEEVKKLMVDGTVNVNVDKSLEVLNYLKLGQYALDKNDLAEAEKYATKCLECDADHYSGWYLTGIIKCKNDGYCISTCNLDEIVRRVKSNNDWSGSDSEKRLYLYVKQYLQDWKPSCLDYGGLLRKDEFKKFSEHMSRVRKIFFLLEDYDLLDGSDLTSIKNEITSWTEPYLNRTLSALHEHYDELMVVPESVLEKDEIDQLFIVPRAVEGKRGWAFHDSLRYTKQRSAISDVIKAYQEYQFGRTDFHDVNEWLMYKKNLTVDDNKNRLVNYYFSEQFCWLMLCLESINYIDGFVSEEFMIKYIRDIEIFAEKHQEALIENPVDMLVGLDVEYNELEEGVWRLERITPLYRNRRSGYSVGYTWGDWRSVASDTARLYTTPLNLEKLERIIGKYKPGYKFPELFLKLLLFNHEGEYSGFVHNEEIEQKVEEIIEKTIQELEPEVNKEEEIRKQKEVNTKIAYRFLVIYLILLIISAVTLPEAVGAITILCFVGLVVKVIFGENS